MKKKLLALTLGRAVTLTSATAFAMTVQEAKNLADTFVPADAKYSKLMRLDNEIEFYYYTPAYRYEVEFDTKKEMVKGLAIERIAPIQYKDTKISQDDAIAILKEHYPDAQLKAIYQYKESGSDIYEMEFLLDNCHGEMDVLASDGTILDIDLDY